MAGLRGRKVRLPGHLHLCVLIPCLPRCRSSGGRRQRRGGGGGPRGCARHGRNFCECREGPSAGPVCRRMCFATHASHARAPGASHPGILQGCTCSRYIFRCFSAYLSCLFSTPQFLNPNPNPNHTTPTITPTHTTSHTPSAAAPTGELVQRPCPRWRAGKHWGGAADAAAARAAGRR